MREKIEAKVKELLAFARHADVQSITDYITYELNAEERLEAVEDINDMINLLSQ